MPRMRREMTSTNAVNADRRTNFFQPNSQRVRGPYHNASNEGSDTKERHHCLPQWQDLRLMIPHAHAHAPNQLHCGLAQPSMFCNKPPLVGDCCGTDEVISMSDLSPHASQQGPHPYYIAPATVRSHTLFLHHAYREEPYLAQHRPSNLQRSHKHFRISCCPQRAAIHWLSQRQ